MCVHNCLSSTFSFIHVTGDLSLLTIIVTDFICIGGEDIVLGVGLRKSPDKQVCKL